MPRILILGNSGSGKSTLARALAERTRAISLDLDTIAWEPDQPGVRRQLAASMQLLRSFVSAHEDWVIEGCYATLAAAAAADATEFTGATDVKGAPEFVSGEETTAIGRRIAELRDLDGAPLVAAAIDPLVSETYSVLDDAKRVAGEFVEALPRPLRLRVELR